MSDFELLVRFQRSFDPTSPANDSQYVETEAARGIPPLYDLVLGRLESLPTGSRMALPFSGHIGSGKSTELRRIVKRGNEADGQFFFIYVDVDAFLETLDVSPDDIYLGLVGELARSAAENDIDFRAGYFEKKWDEIKGYLFSEVRSEGLELGREGIKAKFRLQSTSSENRRKIRDVLSGGDDSLRRHVNDVLVEYRTKLRQKLKNPNLQTILVFDGCERIRRYRNAEIGLESFRQLFIEDSAVFTELESHVITTMPINAARACAQSLQARYSSQLLTMPSIKVTEKDGTTPYPAGRHVMRELVSKRVPEGSLGDYFQESAFDSLVGYSGGYLRGFISAVENACASARRRGVLPIDLESVYEAFNGFVANNTAALTNSKWRCLAELELNPLRTVDPENGDVQELLSENLILEYLNGPRKDGSPFDKFAPWYATHPVIRELESFRVAIRELKEEAKSNDAVG